MKRMVSKTCIAVVRDKKKLWMAGERRLNWDDGLVMASTRSKISLKNGVLLGASGLGYLCSEVVDFFNVPDIYPSLSTSAYMQQVFMPELINHLRDGGHLVKDEKRLAVPRPELSDSVGAEILVGIGTDLFEVALSELTCSFDIIPTPYAIGCGQPYALASLMTTHALENIVEFKMSPKERLKLAIQVAAHLSPGCDSNIDILHN